MLGEGDFGRHQPWFEEEIHGIRDKKEFLAVETALGEVRYSHDASLLHADQVCALCRTPGSQLIPLRMCRRCWAVRYCSKQCQEEAYEDHKVICRKRAESLWHINVGRLPCTLTHQEDKLSFVQPWGIVMCTRASGKWELLDHIYLPTHHPPLTEQITQFVLHCAAKFHRLDGCVNDADVVPKITISDPFEVIDVDEMREALQEQFQLGDMNIMCMERVEAPADFETSLVVSTKGVVDKVAMDEASSMQMITAKLKGLKGGAGKDAPKWRDARITVPCPTRLDIDIARGQVAGAVLSDLQVLPRWVEGVQGVAEFLTSGDTSAHPRPTPPSKFQVSVKDLNSADPFSLFQQGVKPPMSTVHGLDEEDLREFFYAAADFVRAGIWGRVAGEHVFMIKSMTNANDVSDVLSETLRKRRLFSGDIFHITVSGQQGHHYGVRIGAEKVDMAQHADVEEWCRFVDTRGVDFSMLHAIQAMGLEVADELGVAYPVPVVERAEYSRIRGQHVRSGTHRSTPPIDVLARISLALRALPAYLDQVDWPGASTRELDLERHERVVDVAIPGVEGGLALPVLVRWAGLTHPFEERPYAWHQPVAHDEYYYWQRTNMGKLTPAQRMVARQIHLKSSDAEVDEAAAAALAEDPGCAEAFILKADICTHIAGDALDLFLHAREVLYQRIQRNPPAKRILHEMTRWGSHVHGELWHSGEPDIQLYLMVSHGAMQAMEACGRTRDAIVEGVELLRLNTADDQEVRSALMRLYMEDGRLEPCGALLDGIEAHKPHPPDTFVHAAATMRGSHLMRKQYNEITVKYTRALLAFKVDGDSYDASELLNEGLKTSREVAFYLVRRLLVPEDVGGGADRGAEAKPNVEYVRKFCRFWWTTPGAVEWLHYYLCLRGLCAGISVIGR